MFYNLSKSVRPFTFDNLLKNDGTSSSVDWDTRPTCSLMPLLLSLCYLRMHINTLCNVYIFVSNQQSRGSVGPVKQQYKLKWPDYDYWLFDQNQMHAYLSSIALSLIADSQEIMHYSYMYMCSINDPSMCVDLFWKLICMQYNYTFELSRCAMNIICMCEFIFVQAMH